MAVEQSVLRKLIDQLRRELAEIDYTIRALEALASGKRRRGRPPKFVAESRSLKDKDR